MCRMQELWLGKVRGKQELLLAAGVEGCGSCSRTGRGGCSSWGGWFGGCRSCCRGGFGGHGSCGRGIVQDAGTVAGEICGICSHLGRSAGCGVQRSGSWGGFGGCGSRGAGRVHGAGAGQRGAGGHGSPEGCAGGLDTRQPGKEAAGEDERGDTGAEEDPPQPARLAPLSQAAGERSQCSQYSTSAALGCAGNQAGVLRAGHLPSRWWSLKLWGTTVG